MVAFSLIVQTRAVLNDPPPRGYSQSFTETEGVEGKVSGSPPLQIEVGVPPSWNFCGKKINIILRHGAPRKKNIAQKNDEPSVQNCGIIVTVPFSLVGQTSLTISHILERLQTLSSWAQR